MRALQSYGKPPRRTRLARLVEDGGFHPSGVSDIEILLALVVGGPLMVCVGLLLLICLLWVGVPVIQDLAAWACPPTEATAAVALRAAAVAPVVVLMAGLPGLVRAADGSVRARTPAATRAVSRVLLLLGIAWLSGDLAAAMLRGDRAAVTVAAALSLFWVAWLWIDVAERGMTDSASSAAERWAQWVPRTLYAALATTYACVVVEA